MKKLRITAVLLMVIVVFSAFAGCGDSKKEPEVGVWYAEYTISDLDDSSMTEEDKMLMTMLTGNTMFEIYLEFYDDNTMKYKIDTEKLEEALTETMSSLMGMFMDIDVSVFTDRLVEAAFAEVMSEYTTEFSGSYTKDEDGIITLVDDNSVSFKLDKNEIIQYNADGSVFKTFEKIS